MLTTTPLTHLYHLSVRVPVTSIRAPYLSVQAHPGAMVVLYYEPFMNSDDL